MFRNNFFTIMADKLVTLQDENKVPIYPETRASVVKTSSGKTVESELEGKQPTGDYALKSEIPEEYTLPKAGSSALGGIKIGYSENGKNYPVELDSNGAAFVNVPWTDNNTTYNVVGANGTTGLVKNGSSVTSSSGYTACPIIGGVPYYKDTNTTYTLSSFGITATAAELNYVHGVTSAIQTQLNNKAAKITVSNGGSGTVAKQLSPNIYYEFGECAKLTITLASETSGIYNEYMFEFKSGSPATTLSLPSSVEWMGGEAPTIETSKTYQVSIVNNLAVIGGK